MVGGNMPCKIKKMQKNSTKQFQLLLFLGSFVISYKSYGLKAKKNT